MKETVKKYKGIIADPVRRKIFYGVLAVSNGKIIDIKQLNSGNKDDLNKYPGADYILPGFVDSHIHIESTLLTPSEFAKIAVRHGTVAAVCDPHEIANICGTEGIKYMIEEGRKSGFKFFWSLPSCVPSTQFETNGCILNAGDLEKLTVYPEVKALGEVMDYPSVFSKEKTMMNKLKLAKKYQLIMDGHAPGLSQEDIRKYAQAGISTDHESVSMEEALVKIKSNIMISIREGSAAKNFEALHPLLDKYSEKCMFCSDDKHPDELSEGHIDSLVARSLKQGYEIFKVLSAASFNPVTHYNLDVGLLQKGDDADFIVVDGERFAGSKDILIKKTVIKGDEIYCTDYLTGGEIKTEPVILNNFKIHKIREEDLKIKYFSDKNISINIINLVKDQLVTRNYKIFINSGKKNSLNNSIGVPDFRSIEKILEYGDQGKILKGIEKICVINRYYNSKPVTGFVKGFSIRSGAIASSISHDSHNVIAAGSNDHDLCRAINRVIEAKGGMAVYSSDCRINYLLPLPIGGVMSNQPYQVIVKMLKELRENAEKLQISLRSPFMTLSFLSLLVIPELKIGDKGLFDSRNFHFIPVIEY